jgi:hypothetical protein
VLVAAVAHWAAHNLEPIPSVLPAVLGTCALAIGMQNVLGGFLLAIVSGNSAEFLRSRPPLATQASASGRVPAMEPRSELPAEQLGNA